MIPVSIKCLLLLLNLSSKVVYQFQGLSVYIMLYAWKHLASTGGHSFSSLSTFSQPKRSNFTSPLCSAGINGNKFAVQARPLYTLQKCVVVLQAWGRV